MQMFGNKIMSKAAEVVTSEPLMTRNMTPADYESAYVESSGTTADIVPVSLSQSFVGSYLGKQVMDLQNTTRTFNDSLTAGPITDVEAFYENPFVTDPFRGGNQRVKVCCPLEKLHYLIF